MSRTLFALLVAGLLATSCKDKPAPTDAPPKQRTKEEFLQVLDKNRDEYLRCEKLLEKSRASIEGHQHADHDSGHAVDGGRGDASTGDAAIGADAAPEAGARPALTIGLEYGECSREYWKKVKSEVGPYDQAKADEWYSEWRKGVKVE